MTKVALIVYGTLLCLAGGIWNPSLSFAKNRGDEIAGKYPEARFIVRSGTGETPEAAAEAARFEIAKFFESKISGETLVREWAQSESVRGKTARSQMTAITNTVIVKASREIPGIVIETNGQDAKSKRFEAWAVVDREKLAPVLEERIADSDNETDRLLARTGEADLKRVASLALSMRLLADREQDRADLKLLGRDPGSRVAMLHSVMTALDSLIAGAFDVGLVFEGTMDGGIRAALFKGIVDSGIRVKEFPDIAVAAAAGSDLTVAIAHQPTKRTTGQTLSGKEYVFHWVDWVLSIKSLDPSTGEVTGTTVFNDKVSGGSAEQANERMANRILQKQVPAVTAWMYGTVFAPSKKE
jgi:hypothetical protein